MTQEEIIRMAREAGGTAYTNRHCPGETAMAFGPQALERFAQLVAANAAATEREACVKLIESRKTGADELMDSVRDMEARAIRARGQQ